MTLLIDGKLQQIVDWNHHKPGKGGAVVRTKLKEVETGKVVEKTFRAGEDVEQAIVERSTVQFLYREGRLRPDEQRHLRAAARARRRDRRGRGLPRRG
jgi:translation elongation factor P/translation initiation factor 5A